MKKNLMNRNQKLKIDQQENLKLSNNGKGKSCN